MPILWKKRRTCTRCKKEVPKKALPDALIYPQLVCGDCVPYVKVKADGTCTARFTTTYNNSVFSLVGMVEL